MGRKRLVVFAVAFLVMLFILSKDTLAISDNNSGFSVSPVMTELSIDPGTSQGGELTISNDTDEALEINLSSAAFEVINQQYDYAFTEDSNVASWVRFDETIFTINGGDTKAVAYSISAPLTAEPGGRYISLFVSNDSVSNTSGAISRQRIASLLYINVSGDVTKTGSLVSFSAPWLIVDDGRWSAAIRNSGTTHFRSRYNVAIYNLIGEKISESEYSESIILPGTVRLISDDLQSPTIPGLYKIVYTIGLGDSPAEELEKYAIVLPAYFLLTIVSASAVTTIAIFYKKSKRKKS